MGSQEAGRRLLHYDSDIRTVVVAVGQFWYLPLTVWRIGHCRCGLAGALVEHAHGRQPRALTGTRCTVSSVTSAATFTAVQSLRRALELDPSDPLSPLANILVTANAWYTTRPGDGLAYLQEASRLAPAVNMGFFPQTYITGLCPFNAPLRPAAGFSRVATKAAELRI